MTTQPSLGAIVANRPHDQEEHGRTHLRFGVKPDSSARGGTLPIPLYVLYEPKMGFGSLGVTVVFAVYVMGTLGALLAFGDLSDHFGRKKVLATAVSCA